MDKSNLTLAYVIASTAAFVGTGILAIRMAHKADKLAHECNRLIKLDAYKDKWFEKLIKNYVSDEKMPALYNDIMEEMKFFNVVLDYEE